MSRTPVADNARRAGGRRTQRSGASRLLPSPAAWLLAAAVLAAVCGAADVLEQLTGWSL